MVAYCPVNAWEYVHLVEPAPPGSQKPVGNLTWGVLGSVSIHYGPVAEPVLGKASQVIRTRFFDEEV